MFVVLETLVTTFEFFCTQTGLFFGATPHELFWFRSPLFHVLEFLIGVLVCVFLYFFFARHFFQKVHLFAPYAPKPPFFMDQVIGAAMSLCLAVQLVEGFTKKITKQELERGALMSAAVAIMQQLQPLNVICVAWSYSLLSKPSRFNLTECRVVAGLATLATPGCVLVFLFKMFSFLNGDGPLLSPPLSSGGLSLGDVIRTVVYVTQNALVLFAPHYWAAQHGFLPLSGNFLMTFSWTALAVSLFVFAQVAYFTGVNIQYSLYPPVAGEGYSKQLFASVAHTSAGSFIAALLEGRIVKYYRFLQFFFIVMAGSMYWKVVHIVDAGWKRFRLVQHQQVGNASSNKSSGGVAKQGSAVVGQRRKTK